MIFNKNNDGAGEVRALTGMYYQDNDFSRIETNIILETRTISNIISAEVYERAEKFYLESFVDDEVPTGEIGTQAKNPQTKQYANMQWE